MKRTRVILALGLSSLIFNTNKATAQIQKNNLMVGADIADINLGFQKNNTAFSLSLNPKVGYFIEDNMALGAMVNLGINTSTGYTSVNYGIGIFGRYYIADQKAQVLKHSRFFLEGNVGINGLNTKVTGQKAVTTNGLGIGFGPGFAYFITPNVGLEALLKYNLTVGIGNSVTNNQLGFGIGFQIYLPTKKAKGMIREIGEETNK